MIDKSFTDTLEFVYKTYEGYLLMYWENQRIDFSLYTNEMLADPNDAIQYSMENLIYQLTSIEKDLPHCFDKSILRVKCEPMKKALSPLPKDCLHKIFNMMPLFISKMS